MPFTGSEKIWLIACGFAASAVPRRPLSMVSVPSWKLVLSPMSASVRIVPLPTIDVIMLCMSSVRLRSVELPARVASRSVPLETGVCCDEMKLMMSL